MAADVGGDAGDRAPEGPLRESFSKTTDDKSDSFTKSSLHLQPMQTLQSSSLNRVQISFPLMSTHRSPILSACPNPSRMPTPTSQCRQVKSRRVNFSVSRELEPLLGRSCRQANTDEGRGWRATAHRPSPAHCRFLDGPQAKNVFYTLKWLTRSMTREVT